MTKRFDFYTNTKVADGLGGAPGWPGIAPTWTSSAKDLVTTALGGSRVWACIGHGIINEVYWPSAGEPQIRDLGFIVAGPTGWHELKRVGQYRLSLMQPFVPIPRIVHEGEGYCLELDLSPDPLRDVVLVSFRLTGEDVKLYVLLAPHLGGSGLHNNARVADGLVAWKEGCALHLAADCGFSRASAGYVGFSDGWQDFFRHARMDWTYQEALDGNVALMGELSARAGVLALGFAGTREGARSLARSSLVEGFDSVQRSCAAAWQAWASEIVIPQTTDQLQHEAYLSAMVLKVHEGRTYPGALIASLSIPWGNTSDSTGGYHLVWTRDAVEAAFALVAVGCVEDARRVLGYMIATQQTDGSWSQNSFPDGRPFWTGVQLDEVGFPVLLAAKLAELGAIGRLTGAAEMMTRAIGYLARNGPGSPQDRWEENAGISPFTLGVEIAALVAAAEHLPAADSAYALSLADYWNERLEDWTYVENGMFSQTFGIDGYYVRIAAPLLEGGLCGRIDIRNRAGKSAPAVALIGMECLYLARLGLRDAHDRRIQNTVKIIDGLLGVQTPHGIGYRRYNEDGYGEHENGAPFDGTGIGRLWPLLTGERAHLDLLLGIDPLPYLEMMSHMTGASGLIPEQVWDTDPIPERGLEPGKPTGGAMPLVWAHAEFLKLLVARHQRRPLERLSCVDRRYQARRPEAVTWHWREPQPFDALPAGRTLLIENIEPFRLHYGFDGWDEVIDMPSESQGLSIHGVRIDGSALVGHSTIDFTIYSPESQRWAGVDYHIVLQSETGKGVSQS
ncbi:glucan 1,4-alpha-glucosidase [Paraburkholderia terrae]|uniref:glycoside hydrolase family 15 protein n=1 Tax=Paraburkholderia terrae TaxID=311230 RepID=UPI0030DFFD90